MVFPVVMYGCESWTVKKAERWRIDAFELWCWWRLLRVPWTARRSNQSILKEISPGLFPPWLNCQICPSSIVAGRLKQFHHISSLLPDKESIPAHLLVVQQESHLSLSCSGPVTVSRSSWNWMQPGAELRAARLQRCLCGYSKRWPTLRVYLDFPPKRTWRNECWIAKSQWPAVTAP